MAGHLGVDVNLPATRVGASGVAVAGACVCAAGWRRASSRERRLIAALGELAGATSRQLDARQQACDAARRAMNADVDALFVPDDGHLIGDTVSGAELPTVRVAVDHPRSLIARAFRDQEMIFVNSGESFDLPVVKQLGARALLAAPVTRVGFRFGVNVWAWRRRKRRLSDHDRRLAGLLADEKGMTIQYAERLTQAVELMRTQVRARVARDLHDSVVQELAVMTIYAKTAADALTLHPEVLSEVVPEIESHASKAHQEMRDLLDALRVGRPLVELHLDDLVDAVAADFRHRCPMVGLSVETSPADGRDVRPAVREAVYFVLREGLHNVATHGAAHTVGVQLEVGPDGVRLVVRDDGCGFDLGTVHQRRHGLSGMQERAQLAGGRLEIVSSPGHGTIITLRVDDPCPPEPERVVEMWPAGPAA
jgi:signal transduction histidine kinase